MAVVFARLARRAVVQQQRWCQQNRSVCSTSQLLYCAPPHHSMDNTLRLQVEAPLSLMRPMEIPGGSEGRLLLGPGPSNCSPRVREALSRPLLGHLHPEFLKVMDEAKAGIRYLFQTTGPIVCCVSGTGHAGMEAMITNLLEQDEVLLVAETGIWGQRAADMGRRNGADVRVLKATPGDVLSLEQFEEALLEHRPALLLVVHAESSTGVLQPLQGIGELCRKYNCLLCVDAVASAGGAPLLMDEWQVDAVYTGSQKVLSAPPGLAPCALNDRARDKLTSRRTPSRSFYMDLLELGNYWGCDQEKRRYHHTGPITSVYGLREALAILTEEGLEQCWERHQTCAKELYAGLKRIGLQPFVDREDHRAVTVTTITVPEGVKWDAVTAHIMQKYAIEVSGGLGPTAGKVWRIGLMGQNCTLKNVHMVLRAMEEALSIAKTTSKL